MSVNVTAAAQLSVMDPVNGTPENPLQTGGIPLYCPNGLVAQDATLAPSTSLLPLSFPVGVTTAVVIYIAATLAVDLVVNIGSTPFAMSVPRGQGVLLYNLTSAQISVSSVLGGNIQYAVGG